MIKTLLVVDDEEELLAMVSAALRNDGFIVREALGAAAAIAICEEPHTTIDLILSDFQMPDMNGLQLLDRVVSLRPGIAVILMSANMPDRESIAQRGFDFIEKPFTLADLMRRIRKRLSAAASMRP